MPQIHPTAILEGDITLADDVVIGQHCVLQGDITLGSGTHLIGNCYLTGKLVMGRRNVVYPFSSIGFAAQDINFPPDMFEPGVLIGDDNVFRENVTIHRATREHPTTIGDGNMFMVASHVGHDCFIGNNTTIVNVVSLAGHVHIHDHVTIGASTCIHQFVTLGRGAMLHGAMFTTYDIPPYFMLTGDNIIGSLNIIGMRRSGMPQQEITRRKEIYKLLYRSGKTLKHSLEQLKACDDQIANEYTSFIESSRRGIVPPQHKKRLERRGSAPTHE